MGILDSLFPKQPTGLLGGGFGGFLRNNPAMLMQLGSAIGGNAGFSNVLSAIGQNVPQAMAYDRGNAEERTRRQALTKFLKAKQTGTALDPDTMALFEAYPDIAEQYASGLISPEAKKYGFEDVDGTLLRTDPIAGTAEPVYGGAMPGGAAPLFKGTSVEAQSLNGLVESGDLTRTQALQIGAGKTISGPNGELIFMTPQGIFSQNTPNEPPAPYPPQSAEPNPPEADLTTQPPTAGPLAVQPPREGMIPLTAPQPGAGLTPAEKAVDTKYAADYAEWVAAGGYADVEKQIGQLEEAAKALETKGNLTGWFVGNVPDLVGAAVNPEAIATRDAVEEVVQRNLRLVLGAQFTEREGERLIARAYNPKLDEAENAKRVRRLIEQIRAAANAKNSAAEYFSQYGTLKGWSGRLPSIGDFNPEGDADPAAALRQKYGLE